MSKGTKAILICYLLVIVAALFALTSCNPVKRVLLNDEYYKIVTDKFVSEGGCVNDTIWSSPDSVVVFDTLYSLDFKTDTFNIFNEKVIVQTKYKTIEKKVVIRDTAVVTDYARIKLLNEKIAAKDAEINTAKNALKSEQLKTKQQQQRANKWVFNFWALIVAVSIYVFRKPIFRLITKIKI